MKNKGGLWMWVGGGLAVIGVVAVIGAAWMLHAQPFPGRWGGGPMMAFGSIMRGLDLTADQRHQIAAILRTHKGEFMQAGQKMSEAGTAMMEGVADQDAKLEALQAKMDALAVAVKQMGGILLTARREAIAILSPQQKQQLAKREQSFLQRMEAHSGEFRQIQERHIDKLIDELSR